MLIMPAVSSKASVKKENMKKAYTRNKRSSSPAIQDDGTMVYAVFEKNRRLPKNTIHARQCSQIRIGTDFSGIEAPLLSLRRLNERFGLEKPIDFVHKFSCDINKTCRAVSQATFAPEIYYEDQNLFDIKNCCGRQFFSKMFGRQKIF